MRHAMPRVLDLPLPAGAEQAAGVDWALQVERRRATRQTAPVRGSRTRRRTRRCRRGTQIVLTDASVDADAVGAHTPAAGGLAKAALPYVDAVARRSRAGLRVQLARLGAAARRPGAGRRVPRRLRASAACPAYVHASLLVNLGSPTAATVERSVETLAHALRRGAAIGAHGVVFHAGSSVDAEHADDGDAPGARGAAAAARRAPTRPGRGCWWSRARAAGVRWRRGWRTWGRTSTRSTRHPRLGRLLRHLPRLGGRARPGHARRHDRDARRAGARSRRRTGCGWSTPTTPRTRAARPGTGTRRIGKGTIGAAAFARAVRATRRSPACR